MRLIILLCLVIPIFGEELELKHVNLMFRHGARTPLVDTYPTDPLINHTYPPYGLGTLLPIGKLQGYELGQQLRKRYDEFLGKTYSNKDFQLYSDSSVRVQETALMAMAALWPPTKEEKIIDLNWQPVSYQFREYYPTMDRSENGMFEHVYDTPEFKKALEPYNKSIDFILEKSGFTYIKNLPEVFSTTSSQTVLGMATPEWTHSIFPEPISTLTYFIHSAPVYTAELRKYGCNLLTEWVANIDRIVAQLEEPKAKLYAAHDNNIVPMLGCLNIFNPPEPNYVANLATELYKNGNNTYFVKVVYQIHHDKDPQVLTVPGCDSLCDLEKFKAIVEDWTSGVEPKLSTGKLRLVKP